MKTALAFAGMALAIATIPGPVDAARPTPTHMPTKPCKNEDSSNCFWDAGMRGNRRGHSYWVDSKGNVHYLDPRVTR